MKRRILALLTAVVMAVTLPCTCAAPVAAEGYPLPDDITVMRVASNPAIFAKEQAEKKKKKG